jgi:hypothetical protein
MQQIFKKNGFMPTDAISHLLDSSDTHYTDKKEKVKLKKKSLFYYF